jgi:hypothetical protein
MKIFGFWQDWCQSGKKTVRQNGYGSYFFDHKVHGGNAKVAKTTVQEVLLVYTI